jgi:LPS-assembly lipoprotein
MLRNQLLDRFQPAGAAPKALYGLAIGLQVQRVGLGILTDETATRANLIMTANYSVRDLANGDVVFRGVNRSITGYNVLDSEFATVSSENDAIRRAVSDLTEQITTRVSLVLVQQKTAQKSPQ